jgi:hypothetical protein
MNRQDQHAGSGNGASRTQTQMQTQMQTDCMRMRTQSRMGDLGAGVQQTAAARSLWTRQAGRSRVARARRSLWRKVTILRLMKRPSGQKR